MYDRSQGRASRAQGGAYNYWRTSKSRITLNTGLEDNSGSLTARVRFDDGIFDGQGVSIRCVKKDEEFGNFAPSSV